MTSAERTPSGIADLDQILGGGFPRERVILLIGGPGTGKTIFSTQFLLSGIKNGENGVFVSLDESKDHILREMSHFKWNLEELEKERKMAFVDASPIRHLPGEVKLGKMTVGKRDFSLISLIEGIRKGFESVNAKRVVVDSLGALTLNYPDQIQKRTGILDLVEALSETKATCLLTTELRTSGLERRVQLEEYLAHGVIILQTMIVGKSYLRAIQVVKMREAKIDLQPRPYRITENGIEIYPSENIF